MKITSLALLLLLGSCSFKKNPLGNQTPMGHEELYTEPSEPKANTPEDLKKVVIVATNDLEGSYSPSNVEFTDKHRTTTQTIQIGGGDALAQYFKILREQFGDLVLVDSGDLFSTEKSAKEIKKFYDQNGYDAVTLGLNDFRMKLPKGVKTNPELFKSFAAEKGVPLLVSNLYELKTARTVEWKGAAPYVMKNVNGVKVGIVGIIPDDIAILTPVDNRVGLFVESMLQSTLRQARLLRSLGAEVIVVITHQGMTCGREIAQEAKLPLEKVNFEPTKKDVCDLDNQLGAFLERLPPHLVDVVIGGRHHEKMANVVNETVVLSGFPQGQSLSYVEFFVDPKTKKVQKDLTVIHQPVMACREFFKETNDCFTEDKSVDHNVRIPASFLGKEIKLEKVEGKNAEVRVRNFDPREALTLTAADIVYQIPSSGASQLIALQMGGKTLIKLLEEDFNAGEVSKWSPSPFLKKEDSVAFIIQGEPVSAQKMYSVLTDLEALERSVVLKRTLKTHGGSSFPHFSWSSLSSEDHVDLKMAARSH